MSAWDNQPTFSFGIVRLLLAVAVFAIAFALTKPLGAIGILFGLLVSIPIAAIVLVARRRHTRAIIRSVLCSAIGMVLGYLYWLSSSFEFGGEYRCMIVGVILCWAIGITADRIIIDYQEPVWKQMGLGCIILGSILIIFMFVTVALTW